jgi:hypothetical protein
MTTSLKKLKPENNGMPSLITWKRTHQHWILYLMKYISQNNFYFIQLFFERTLGFELRAREVWLPSRYVSINMLKLTTSWRPSVNWYAIGIQLTVIYSPKQDSSHSFMNSFPRASTRWQEKDLERQEMGEPLPQCGRH